MRRPGHRDLVRLPTLAPLERELETCTFCPKLCRSACPVSNAEPRETLTPWGKMSLVSHMGHGDVPIDASHAHPAWACTGCGQCTKRCDHAIDVGAALRSARAALTSAGVAPEALRRIEAQVDASDLVMRGGAGELADEPAFDASSRHGLLIGCSYHRRARPEARLALRVAHALTGERHRVVVRCCGAPLEDAGLPEPASERRRIFEAEHAELERLVIVDPGCAVHLGRSASGAPPRSTTLVALAAQHLDRLTLAPGLGEEPLRWHDPCRLGRGLGLYEAPRHVLARILGRSPDEFARRREAAACSGAGALLPLTFPDVASAAADRRAAEHAELGGGRVVTGCASSLASFRRAGIDADDIVTWMARALGVEGVLR